MVYRIGQIRFDANNKPQGNENIFKDILKEQKIIVQLGIQAPPKTKFVINNFVDSYVTDIEIGTTGIFELDLRGANTGITNLVFRYIEEGSNEEPWTIQVDYLYED